MFSAFALRHLRQSNHTKNKEKTFHWEQQKTMAKQKQLLHISHTPEYAVLIILRKQRVNHTSKKKEKLCSQSQKSQVSSTIHRSSAEFPGDETWRWCTGSLCGRGVVGTFEAEMSVENISWLKSHGLSHTMIFSHSAAHPI